MQEALAYVKDLDEATRLVAGQALRIVVILLVAWVLHMLSRRLIQLFRAYVARRTGGDEIARIETLARVFRNAAGVVIVIVAGTLILDTLSISIAPILATAGVAGLAIGFGAQSLIKDYFNGFFLLLDDQVRQGDVVEIAGKGGFVEEVTLRYVRLRDLDSHVYYVPNGEITLVINRTRGYATPLLEIALTHREDPDEVIGVMRELLAAMRAEPAWAELIVEDLEVLGMDRWTDVAVIVRARIKVIPPIQQWSVKREYIKRLKRALDERGIEVARPHLTVYPGRLKDGSAPPLHVITSEPPSP